MDQHLPLRRLEVFCLVVEVGSVTRAAERLMVAQPAVSSQIKALEEWFGAPLFTRNSGRIQLNEAGQRAYAWARETLAGSVAVRRDVQELAAGGAGRVVISASMAVGSYLLPKPLTRLRAERQGAEITLHVAEPESAIRAVETGEADFAVVTWDGRVQPTTLSHRVLVKEPLLLCASPGVETPTEPLTIHRLAQMPFVSVPPDVAFNQMLEGQLRAQKVPPLHTVIHLGHAEAMKQAVVDHGWVTLLPAYCVQDDVDRGRLRILEVRDLDVFEPIALVQRKDYLASPLQQAALTAIVMWVSEREIDASAD